MKVLIVAEGKHERSGSLETLVRRLLSCDLQFDVDDIHRRLSPLHGIGGFDYCKRALQWVQEAQKRGYDAVVLLLDEDGYPDRIKGIDRRKCDCPRRQCCRAPSASRFVHSMLGCWQTRRLSATY